MIGGLIGILAGVGTLGACLGLAWLVSNAIGPVGGSEFAEPVALLAAVSLGFLLVVIAWTFAPFET